MTDATAENENVAGAAGGLGGSPAAPATFELEQERDYSGPAAGVHADVGDVEIAGRFKVIELGAGFAVLEDVRADEFAALGQASRDLHRYRIATE
jgi:hypothetical protein